MTSNPLFHDRPLEAELAPGYADQAAADYAHANRVPDSMPESNSHNFEAVNEPAYMRHDQVSDGVLLVVNELEPYLLRTNPAALADQPPVISDQAPVSGDAVTHQTTAAVYEQQQIDMANKARLAAQLAQDAGPAHATPHSLLGDELDYAAFNPDTTYAMDSRPDADAGAASHAPIAQVLGDKLHGLQDRVANRAAGPDDYAREVPDAYQPHEATQENPAVTSGVPYLDKLAHDQYAEAVQASDYAGEMQVRQTETDVQQPFGESEADRLESMRVDALRQLKDFYDRQDVG
jgi:hypothetical protein